uniref:MADS-box domain-containing protein n=1 Tax=Oryza glumipatula TaxID=40148 RepID=A0A0E0AQ33_9ORYZ
MARGKVQLRRIENPVHRQVTFCKRRAGLLKKARELSILCEADIGIIIFSAHGKLYDLSTTGTMEELIERYKSASGEQANACGDQRMDPKQEAMVLKQEINLLQKGLRYIYGNRANEHMTVEELNALERYLEIWMYNIRSAKEGMLKAANEILQEKIVEQNGLIDVGMMVADQQNGHFSTVPLLEEITNPLTILSGYSTCRGSEMGYSF